MGYFPQTVDLAHLQPHMPICALSVDMERKSGQLGPPERLWQMLECVKACGG